MIRDLAVDTRRTTGASASLALLLIGALVAGLVVLVTPARPALAQTAPATGVYVPLSPARIFNTQAGGGGVVAAQSSRDVQVAGLGGIPTTDVLAVVLDLTAYNNNSGAWGILWQAGTTRPYPASSINYVPGRVVTNSVTTKVGTSGSAAGKVSFFTWEATDMLIDVVGYYRTAPGGGGGYAPLTQIRILDTAGAKIPANSSIDRKLRGVAGIPDSTAVTAVVFNATVYGASGPGPLTVWPRGVARPDTSVMNYSPATARTEMVTATLSADGWVSVWTWASIDLIIDVAGYYTTGSNSTFVPLTPKRIVDTRYNGTRYNNNPNWGIGPVTQYLAPNTTTAIKVTGTGGVPETGVSPVSTVILNVVADAATTATSSQIGFLTVWASGDAQPGILTMSYYGAESASNLVMAKVGADGKINIHNYYASTELIIDVVGYFTTGTGPGAPTNVCRSELAASDGAKRLRHPELRCHRLSRVFILRRQVCRGAIDGDHCYGTRGWSGVQLQRKGELEHRVRYVHGPRHCDAGPYPPRDDVEHRARVNVARAVGHLQRRKPVVVRGRNRGSECRCCGSPRGDEGAVSPHRGIPGLGVG